jgi:biopolymer transport protein ExbB
MEDLAAFTNDLHGYLMSNGAVKPLFGDTKAAPARGPATTAGRQPVRTGAETPTA